MVLGVPFLREANPIVEWSKREIYPRPKEGVQLLKITIAEPKSFINDLRRKELGGIIYLRQASTEPLEPKDVVPKEYHDQLDAFSKKEADKLPPHRSFDHRIPLIDNQIPPFGPIYSLSILEQEELRRYLDDMLEKGFITPSESPAASPILFVKKKDGSLRLCVDYRRLNAITIKNRYPIPLIGDLLDQLRYAKIFTKIDLRGAHNLLRIAAGEEWKTAFRTRFGLFEYKVMPFGLTNAPASFQHLMNYVFRDMLDVSVIVYLDDILVYSRDRESHVNQVREVLNRLRESGLYAKHDKCTFHTDTVDFLGYVIGPGGVSMDPAKVKAVVEWPRPTNVKETQSFLGFANFYRRFIKDYSRVARPLHELTKADAIFDWTEACEKAMRGLQERITTAPVLRHYDPELQSIVETDASDFALGIVLSQKDDKDTRPVAFGSRSLLPAERNYPIHEKEALAIYYALKEWRQYLEGAKQEVVVLTDHESLKYLMTSKMLNRREARWARYFADFRLTIKHVPGRTAGKPDALSRRVDYMSRDSGPPSMAWDQNSHNYHPLITKTQFLCAAMATRSTTLDDEIRSVSAQDPEIQSMVAALQVNPRTTRPEDDIIFIGPDGILRYKGARIVPKALRQRVLSDLHDSQHSGHPGRQRTYKSIRTWYWWPGMRKEIIDYVTRCATCQRDKASRQKPMGLLMPLPTPSRPWSNVTCDFIGELPPSGPYNSILVVVDRLTKLAHFLPTTTTLSAPEFADLFFWEIYSKHGLPDRLTTDRGSLFTSKFWRSMATLTDLDHRYSTAYHPQTDGQSEIVNQWLEQYLRMYINMEQSNWADLLPQAEFCYNSTPHSTTGLSPLAALTGTEPRKSMMQPMGTLQSVIGPAKERAQQMETIHQQLKHAIKVAQLQHKQQYDKKRRPVNIQPGDRVYLSMKHLSTLRPSLKLDHRFAGPYRVLKKINDNAFQLELPSTLRIHDVLPAALLSKEKGNVGDPLPAHAKAPVDDPNSGFIEGIKGASRRWDGKRTTLHYYVKWIGWEEPTWEPAENIKDDPSFDIWIRNYENDQREATTLPAKRLRKPSQRVKDT